MSQYITFYLKNGDQFLNLASYSRNSKVQAICQEYAPAYSVIKPFSKTTMDAIRSESLEEVAHLKESRELYEKMYEMIPSFNNTVEEKTEGLNEVAEMVEFYTEEINEMQHAITVIDMMDTIAQERQFYTNNYASRDDVIWYGIECELPEGAKNND